MKSIQEDLVAPSGQGFAAPASPPAGNESPAHVARRPWGHEWDEDAICIHCGFDGAEDWWLNDNLRREIGDDEFECRKAQGEFDAGRFCSVQSPDARGSNRRCSGN